MTIAYANLKRLRRKRETKEPLHIALLDMDLSFEPFEIAAVKAGVEAGQDIYAIAEQLERDPDEIAVLLIDLARHDVISVRGQNA